MTQQSKVNPMKIDSINFEEYLENISFLEVESIKSTNSFIDEVQEYAQNGTKLIGSELPFSFMNPYIRLGKGKLSIWAGQSGSGKSLIVGQVMNKLLVNNEKAVIASLEMPPRETLYRMICQSAVCKAGKDYSLKWLNNFSGKLWIYDELDRVSTSRILGMCHYAAHEIKVQHVVIDSLTKCGVGRDDYAKQAIFVDRLQWCAKTWNIHIHLICHMRKSENTGKNDIRGAAEITDLADNVFILDRNREKEKAVDCQSRGLKYNENIISQADAYLKLVKNREFGFEGDFGLYFDRECQLYKQSSLEKPQGLLL